MKHSPMLISYRRFRRTYLRPTLIAIAALFLLDALYLILTRPTTSRVPIKNNSGTASRPQHVNHTTVYIASVHRNTAWTQFSGWNAAVLALVDYLGPENVHVSSVESGSGDETKDMMTELQKGLDARNVSNDIKLGMTVWEQLEELDTRPPPGERKPGWIWNALGNQYEMRRIPYLSRVRNEAMEPLERLRKEGRRFDKVLWLNDVVFDNQDIETLFQTRGGDYAAACAMDYKVSPLYYDTFALRDDQGQKTTSLYWPWFLSSKSRGSALRNEPIDVKSCWNGIVAFDAAPFYANPPLQFRGIPDSLADLHLEGSECCLIHADNYLTAERGVWLNPNVRVGYSVEAYREITAHDRFPSAYWTVAGRWINRARHWRMAVQVYMETKTVQKRMKQWVAETPSGTLPRFEPGEACLINEMQIMWSNGWKHL